MSDLISRQAAIKAVEGLQDCYNGFSDTYDKACIIGTLEEVPTAQERKGKWVVEYGSDCKTYKVSRCSECGFEYGTVANLFKFCPYCGAHMEGAEDAGRDE